MRICLVSAEYSPFRGGGIGTYVTLMADALVAAGHEVHVLTDPVEGITDGEQREGRRFHFCDVSQGAAALDAFATPHMRRAMAVHEKLQRLHRAYPFDYIEFPEYCGEGYFATRAQKLSRTYGSATLAVHLHTPSRDVDELNDDWTLDWSRAEIDHLEESSIRDADLVVSPTRSLVERMEGRLGPLASKAVVPSPMTPLPQNSTAKRSPGVILYFGRLERRKGVHLLVPALERLLARGLNAELRFVGGDTGTGRSGSSMKADLRRMASARTAARLTFVDSMPRAELAQEIAKAQVCCFPSLWENFPNVCLEAMAQGALVVGSDAGGMAEIIEPEKSGLLFRAGDVDSLAETLERSLTHPQAEALRAAASARIQSYCAPQAVVSLLESVVHAHRTRAQVSSSGLDSAVTTTPKVSVIVPHYNLGKYLPETIASVRAQTYPNVELLIVEDGSTEPESVQAVARAEASGVRVVRQRNAGLSNARNTGLREASGEYVLMLDADDLVDPRYISQCMSILTARPDWLFATAYSRFFREVPEDRPDGWIPWGLERDYLPYRNVASHCSAVFRKEALLQVGGYDEQLTSFEDWELMCRLAKTGAQGAVIPEFLFHYRIRPESMLRTEGDLRRERLISYLLSKHSDLPLNPQRTLRLGVERHTAQPLRYRLVDKLNQGIKRLPVIHPLLRRATRGII